MKKKTKKNEKKMKKKLEENCNFLFLSEKLQFSSSFFFHFF